jgi:hypothetical protein
MGARFARSMAIMLGFLAVFCMGAAGAAELVIYLAPNGNDKADGLTQRTAVASFQIAVDRALEQGSAKHSRLRISVAPGTYTAQRAVTGGTPDGKPLVIMSEKGEGDRPQFDGAGKGGTWLILKNATGKPTHVTVAGLEITNYETAISLNGARGKEATSNSQNVIRNNIFRNIGQIAFPEGKPSTAAVRLVNSDDNQIVRNRFINIRNIKGCGALHSIYLAHYSSGNQVTENVFDGGCGATIKVRDAASNNVIADNQFLNQEEPVFLDTFCDRNAREGCTRAEAECPSWHNEFRGNQMAKLGKKAATSPVKTVGDEQPPGCPSPPADRQRVKQSGNSLR